MNEILHSSESTGITDWRKSIGRTIRTDGCIFFLCTSGRASVTTGMQKTIFRTGDMLVLTSDVYFSVRGVSDSFSARCASLSERMIGTAYYKTASMSLWDYLHFSPILRLTPEQQRLASGWFDQMQWIMENITGSDLRLLLGNNVHNMFAAIDAETARLEPAPPTRRDRAWTITCRFWSLLAKHASRQRSVSFYADALGITPGYLNKACRRAYGTSPKALIEQQVAVEISTLLSDTDMTVAHIADRLGFEDTSYMCRFFRRTTGLSPLEFRSGTEKRNRPSTIRCRESDRAGRADGE